MSTRLYKLLFSQNGSRLGKRLLDRHDLGDGDLLGDDAHRPDIRSPGRLECSGRLDLLCSPPLLDLTHNVRLDVTSPTESVSQFEPSRILDRVGDLPSKPSDVIRQVLGPVNSRGECRGQLSVDVVVLSGELGEMGILDVRQVLSDVTRGLGKEIGSGRDEEKGRKGEAEQNVP